MEGYKEIGRKRMRLLHLFEKLVTEATPEELLKLQQVLIDKISSLPVEGEQGEKTATLIDKIEQALRDVDAGGRVASVLGRVTAINDDDVQKATNKLAKIIAAIDFTGPQIKELFAQWNANKIVNTGLLLSPGSSSHAEIYRGYGSNPAFTEFVDDLNQVSGYGIGEGEFTLAVLSKTISGIGAQGGSGDLIVDGKNVEVKTRSVGAARFTDRDVSVSSNYTQLVDQFITRYKDLIEDSGLKLPAAGMNLKHLTGFANSLQDPKHKSAFKKDISNLLQNIFTKGVDTSPLTDAIVNGNNGVALQLYAQANVNNYLSIKREKGALEGILFIDKNKDSLVYIQQASDLDKTDMRFHMETAYVVAMVKPDQYPFPQMYIK